MEGRKAQDDHRFKDYQVIRLPPKRVVWGESLVLLALGGLATYLNPKVGIPILFILLGMGIWLIISANKRAMVESKNNETLYEKEWEHFNRLIKTINDLHREPETQITKSEIMEVIKIINIEKIYLDDNLIQQYLEHFIYLLETECMELVCVPHSYINIVIQETTKRMNKKYKRG